MHITSEPVQRSALPVPDRAALEHSQRLSHRIRLAIERNNGFISFAEYMRMALYEQGLGYYSAGARKFGPAGDFITAPELSPLFARCLARQCEQILPLLDRPVILEPGPGSGVMACELLQALDQRGCLPERYFMLETSADLRERQQQRLREEVPHLSDRVLWLEQLPARFAGIILGNEVLDALPVHRVILQQGDFFELGVGITDELFGWKTRPLPEELRTVAGRVPVGLMQNLPEGYVTEMNSRIGPWLQAFTGSLERGVMLFIDYGYPRHEYYHPQRTEGTLLCHYRHHVHADPFLYPGLQDITASVEFTAVAEAALEAGLKVSGYTTQAHFLVGCGLEDVISQNHLTGGRDHAELGRQARLLTLPGEMGERFKAIALNKDFDIPLRGFQTLDMRSRL